MSVDMVYVLKPSWEGLVTGKVGPPAGNRPPTTPRYSPRCNHNPRLPSGFFSIPLLKPGFWLSLLSAQICHLNCYSPLPRMWVRQIVSSSGLLYSHLPECASRWLS